MTDELTDLPAAVRSAAAAVAGRARYVRIDPAGVSAIVDALPLDQVAAPRIAPGELPVSAPEEVVAWVLTVNAVNFGSGFFPVLNKRPGLSGSKTVFACLADRFRAAGPLSVQELQAASAAACAALFEQEATGPAAELLEWFAASWRGLGTAVAERWDGRFANVIDDADRSAARLAGLLASVPGWEDRWQHDGSPVPLYKRAQIVPAHVAMAFGGHGLGEFDDLDQLTIFADNLVPHVLRLDGVLNFDPDLVARIEREDLLAPGSPEEVEIRAVGVHAAELIVSEVRRSGHAASAMGLDQVLWNRGAGAAYKARPRHRSRSTAY